MREAGLSRIMLNKRGILSDRKNSEVKMAKMTMDELLNGAESQALETGISVEGKILSVKKNEVLVDMGSKESEWFQNEKSATVKNASRRRSHC